MSDSTNPRLDPKRWEERYVTGDIPWDLDRPDPHLQAVLEAYPVTPGHALDIGCGTGQNLVWLAQQGFEVVGLDVSPTAIAQARAVTDAAGVTCVLAVANILTDPVPGGPFDFVCDRGVMHLFDAPERRARFAEQVAASLKPGGLWHSLSGSTDGPPRDTGPPRRSATEVMQAIEPFFEVLELRETEFDPTGHAGARAWVIVARRRA